jgi:hypothetical protein
VAGLAPSHVGNDKIILPGGLDRQRPAKIDSLWRCLGDDDIRPRMTAI